MASKRQRENNNPSECEKFDNENTSSKNKKLRAKKFSGSLTYGVKFNEEWKQNYRIQAVKTDKHKFHCLPCGENVPCGHQGLRDVKEHCKTSTRTANLASWKKQSKLNFPSPVENHKTKVLTPK